MYILASLDITNSHPAAILPAILKLDRQLLVICILQLLINVAYVVTNVVTIAITIANSGRWTYESIEMAAMELDYGQLWICCQCSTSNCTILGTTCRARPIAKRVLGDDNETGKFTVLPKEWQKVLQENGIGENEQRQNPQAISDIMTFYHGEAILPVRGNFRPLGSGIPIAYRSRLGRHDIMTFYQDEGSNAGPFVLQITSLISLTILALMAGSRIQALMAGSHIQALMAGSRIQALQEAQYRRWGP
ncbi:MAG: hypothetical protein Q9221_002134 [Calogaya cf. arnoldii]